MKTSIDTLYSTPQSIISDFEFNTEVADIFDDMINRSVPGYSAILESLTLIAKRYVQANTLVYDLGCSLGAASIAIQKGIPDLDCIIMALDSSSAMIKKCHTLHLQSNPPIVFKETDICETLLKPTSLTVLNFTLQFIPKKKRTPLIQKIYSALTPQGALILSEKIKFNPEQQLLLDELHQDYKRNQGYSDLEIHQKREAIANQLIPETLEDHQLRLKKIGFKQITVFLQQFNFISIIAIK